MGVPIFSSKKSKCGVMLGLRVADGRIICRHWAGIFLHGFSCLKWNLVMTTMVSTYWGREESLLSGRRAGPEAGRVLMMRGGRGWGVVMEWEMGAGEVRRRAGTGRSRALRTQTAALAVTAAVAAAGRRRRRQHLHRLALQTAVRV